MSDIAFAYDYLATYIFASFKNCNYTTYFHKYIIYILSNAIIIIINSICDRPRENWPSSHLVKIVKIPVLKVVIAFAHVRPALLSRIVLIDILNLIYCT